MIYVPYAALLFAFALIYLPRSVVGAEMKKLAGGYDNSDPRGQQARLEGRGKRALGAHQNALEAFAPFAAGVLAAAQRGAPLTVVAIICIAFVVARTVYAVAYIADKSTLRSGMWGVGVLCTAALLVFALLGA